MTVTRELAEVSTFLVVFAAVRLSVCPVTDTKLRSEFFEDTVAVVRQNLAVRAIYRAASAAGSDPARVDSRSKT